MHILNIKCDPILKNRSILQRCHTGRCDGGNCVCAECEINNNNNNENLDAVAINETVQNSPFQPAPIYASSVDSCTDCVNRCTNEADLKK